MQIRLGELRRLVLEVASPQAHARQLAHTTVKAAHDYVESILAGQPNDEPADQLQELVPQCVSLAKWMLNHRDPKAESFALVAKDAMAMVDKVGFWKRPAFLKKAQYTQQMKDMLRRLDRSYKAWVS